MLLGIFLGSVLFGERNSTVETQGTKLETDKEQTWTCSMHPQVRKPGKGNCPICGMELVPLEDPFVASDRGQEGQVLMSPEAMQLANIQTVKVSRSDLGKEIRLLGKVQTDERRQFSQVSHIPGRIERLYVNFTGERVRKGQKIVRLYSPELISAQKELFEAIKSREVYPKLYEASRNKLKLWKLSDAQIDALITSGEVQEQIDILSDHSGYVMQMHVDPGDHVMTGMSLYEVADIDSVWLMFEAYESDLPWIHIGDEVSYTLQAIPGSSFTGKVTYIDPFISSGTRVAKVRVEVPNKEHRLLPEMFATGRISSSRQTKGDELVIPKSAVLWTGKRSIVYVKEPGQNQIAFSYREVELGADMGEFYAVKRGLAEGEEIATNGVFRIDASAQLSGSRSMMHPDVKVGGPSKENKETADRISEAVKVYMGIKEALVKGQTDEAARHSVEMIRELDKADPKGDAGETVAGWEEMEQAMEQALKQISNGKDLATQRNGFSSLSKALSEAVGSYGWTSPGKDTLYLDFCPMAENDRGGYWLSMDREIRNPYFGDEMLQCGEIVREFR